MSISQRKIALFIAGAIALVAITLVLSSSASAAAVDIRFELNPGEGGCHVWTGRTSDKVQWNLTLRMNGTDTTSQTTPTFVYIDDSNVPARQDNWIFVLTAGQPFAPPDAFDGDRSNLQASGDSAYPPIVDGSTLELALYGEQKSGGASPATVSVILTPNLKSLNKDWHFNISAQTDRTGVPNITRKVDLCVYIPDDPHYEMGNFSYSIPPDDPVWEIDAAGNSTVVVDFWLKNTGNTEDRYYCGVRVPRADWDWHFVQGFQFTNATKGRTNYTQPGQNLSDQNSRIKVEVFVPPTARAQENTTVSIDCESDKLIQRDDGSNISRKPFPPYTRIRVVQYYWICGDEDPAVPTLQEGVPGDNLTFKFSVWNNGNGPDRARAYLAAGDATWSILITPDTWDLKTGGTPPDPGYNGTGEFRVSIPADTPIATYEYQINVTSTQPNTPICPLRFKVSVLQEFIPTVTGSPPQVASLKDEVVFTFRISNEGNGLDSLRVEFFNQSGWRAFLDPPRGEKILDSHEYFDFTLTIIVPDKTNLAPVGIYNTTVKISSVYATDYGLDVWASTNLSIIINPRVQCGMDPTTTDKEFNPYAAPGEVSEANFILTVTNLGNGADGVLLNATSPEGINVTLAPSSLNLKLEEYKAVLVTLHAASSVPPGVYTVNITATSILNASSTCKSQYRVTIYNLDGALNTNVQSFVQDPQDPDKIPDVSVLPVLQQIEGYYVRLRLIVENRGDRAIAYHTLTVTLKDELDCPRAPTGGGNDTCGSRTLKTFDLEVNLTASQLGGATTMEYVYLAPDYLCIDDPVLCEDKDRPPANPHRLTFTLDMNAESNKSNNVASVIVNVLPARLVEPPPPPGELPIAMIVAGAAIAGAAGLVVWYRFLRPPQVDEELYASIYGGGQEAAPEQPKAPAEKDGIDDYFKSQQKPGERPKQYQGMSDEQVEEARKLYGDSYGKRR